MSLGGTSGNHNLNYDLIYRDITVSRGYLLSLLSVSISPHPRSPR